MAIFGRKRTQTSIVRACLRTACLASLCACLLTCNIDLSIDDAYKDIDRNWISSFDLGTARGETTSGWAFDYAGNTGDDFAYMSLTDTGAPVGNPAPEGLDEAARVFRLSINNLMPDPDMDDEPLGAPSARWSIGYDLPATHDPVDDIIGTGGIHGKSFSFDRDQVGQYVRLFLSHTLANASVGLGPTAGSMYQVNFLFKGDGTLLFYSPDGTEELTTDISTGAVTDLHLQSQSYTDRTVDYFLCFGPRGAQSALIDDIRVVRKAIPLYRSLDLKLSDVEPAFISGRYVFSVWVKNDPDASYLFSSGAAAPYQSRAVTLEIRALSNTDGGAIGIFHPDPANEAAGWSEWTRLALEIPVGEKLAIEQTNLDSVLSLKISPTDMSSANGVDAKTILIAAPSLTFHYDD